MELGVLEAEEVSSGFKMPEEELVLGLLYTENDAVWDQCTKCCSNLATVRCVNEVRSLL